MSGPRRWAHVVVGAGSAGVVVAARLAERPGASVLLLEAGPEHRDWRIEMPTAMARAIKGPRFNWEYASEPEPHLGGRVIDHPRGRVLGGSSAINGQVAIRGHREDFDGWAAEGCAGWSWADVLPSFIRMETDLDHGEAAYHGRSGPTPVRRNPIHDWGAIDRALLLAGLALGYPYADDHNAPDATGVSRYAINNTPAGIRVSTADGYLEPIRGRANLTIVCDALVEHVLVEPRGNGVAATGVAAAQERGLTGTTRDTALSAAIQELWFRTNFDMFSKLSSTVTEQRALLTGKVQDPEMRVEAVKLAWQVQGINEVINEIEVTDTSSLVDSARDYWITTQLRARITFDKDVKSINYSIDTVNGVVFLMGIARDQAEHDRVTNHARNLAYVRRVVSYVRIRP